MNLAHAEEIVNAVLYEGYMLYPYRPSSVKNRQRWTFGGVYPQAYSVAHDGSDPWSMQTQCLVRGDANTRLTLRLGFLHLVQRDVGKLDAPLAEWPEAMEPALRKVEMLQIGERRYYAWQEAMERNVDIADLACGDLIAGTRQIPFAFPARRALEPLRDDRGQMVAALIRSQEVIEGQLELRIETVAEQVFRVTARISNITPMPEIDGLNRDAASLFAFVSTHTVLGLERGEFISLLDPPDDLREIADACENLGTYPVLVGVEGQRDTLLSSPIILYDYPEIAPESPGSLFDGTEIDEILTLRILTMTDEEKREMVAVDERARALLERTEALGPEQLARLHGVLRNPHAVPAVASGNENGASEEIMSGAIMSDRIMSDRIVSAKIVSDEPSEPWAVLDAKPRLACLRVGDIELKIGDPVRLRPHGNADIMDIALAGMTATIESIERDFEDRVHVAVTVDDDPGKAFGLDRMPGHRFFFAPDEIESLNFASSEQAPRRETQS